MVWNIVVAMSFAWVFNSLYDNALEKYLEQRYENTPVKKNAPSVKIRLAASLALFLLAGLMRGDNLHAAFDQLVLGMVFLIAVADYRWHKIPNSYLAVTGIFILISLGVGIYFTGEFAQTAKSSFLGLLICGLPVLVTFFITKGAFGMGDVKLMASIGFWLGADKAVIFFASTFVLAAAFAVAMLVLKKITRKSHIPLAPFMAAAAALSISGIIRQLYLF